MADDPLRHLHAHHPRQWRDFDYVYPVISRRSGGMSIGINLNVDKVCNWDCVYCQVDRTVAPTRRDVDLGQLADELHWAVRWAVDGACWEEPPFDQTPKAKRRLNDIAFSGDGEPTTFRQFEAACRIAIEAKKQAPDETKIIVLTNMTMAHREPVQRAFGLLDEHNGQIWAKLETGTAEAYKTIDRSSVPFERILDNLKHTGRQRPLVIQSLFMKLHGHGPAPEAFQAYLERLADLIADGCQIQLIQLYTVARQTAEPYVTALEPNELEALAEKATKKLSDVAIETYPATDA